MESGMSQQRVGNQTEFTWTGSSGGGKTPPRHKTHRRHESAPKSDCKAGILLPMDFMDSSGMGSNGTVDLLKDSMDAETKKNVLEELMKIDVELSYKAARDGYLSLVYANANMFHEMELPPPQNVAILQVLDHHHLYRLLYTRHPLPPPPVSTPLFS
jgi:hypothetical protein